MLKPKYLEQLPAGMVDLYSQVEQDILADMARRISTYDYWIPAADWQYQKLVGMGNFHSYIMEALAARTGKSRKELEQLMQDAGAKTLQTDTRIYRAQGLSPPSLASSEALRKVLADGLKQTGGLFENLTSTTADTATRQFEKALDRAWLQITSGAFDRQTAVRMAVKDLSRQGVGAITYPSGHVDTLEVAVRRAVVTGVNQTALRLQEALADEMGCDLVETTAHSGARPSHAVWQGQVFSRKGRSKKYPNFRKSTGYGTGDGLGGWNCRHSFYPYYEGSPRAYSAKDLAEMDAKKIPYNGQMLTEYEASQQQRYIERQIRRWKREEAAMAAAGESTEEAVAKVAQWQERQRDFVKQTGLKRQYDREQIVSTGTKKTVEKASKSAILTDKDVRAINTYKSARSFGLNAALRGEAPMTEEMQTIARDIDAALEKLPIYKGTVYRSLRSEEMVDAAAFQALHQPGQIVTYSAYTSSGTEVYDPSMDIQLVIQSKRGRDMRKYNPAEKEVLFSRNSRFVVDKREGNTIWLTEI